MWSLLDEFGDWLIQPINCFLALTWCVFGASTGVVIWGTVDETEPPHTFLYLWDQRRMVEANLQCMNLILAMCAVAQHPARILDTKYLFSGKTRSLCKRYPWYTPDRRFTAFFILLTLHIANIFEYANCAVMWFTPRTKEANKTVAVLISLHLVLQIIPTIVSLVLTWCYRIDDHADRNLAPDPQQWDPIPTARHRDAPAIAVPPAPGASENNKDAAALHVPPSPDADRRRSTVPLGVNRSETQSQINPTSAAATSPPGAKPKLLQYRREPGKLFLTVKGKALPPIVWNDVGNWVIQWKNALLIVVFLVVVVTGTMLFFVIIFIIPIPDKDVKMDFIESNAQVLNMIFTVATLAQHPARMMDTIYWLRRDTTRLLKRYPWYKGDDPERRKAVGKILIYLNLNCWVQYLMCYGMWGRDKCCRYIPLLALALPTSFVCGIVGGVLTGKYSQLYGKKPDAGAAYAAGDPALCTTPPMDTTTNTSCCLGATPTPADGKPVMKSVQDSEDGISAERKGETSEVEVKLTVLDEQRGGGQGDLKLESVNL